MTYRIKEVFRSIQGEGLHVGTACVFVRFSGCNLWSGREEHRARDAERHGAACPRFCDTDFVDGVAMSLDELVAEVVGCGGRDVALLVFTGGEPLLQMDDALVERFGAEFPSARLAVETNGTVEASGSVAARCWFTCSPKVEASRLKLVRAHEIKVVLGDADPTQYLDRWPLAHAFIQAEATTTKIGTSLLNADAMRRASAWVMEHRGWRLSVQTHKVVGLR